MPTTICILSNQDISLYDLSFYMSINMLKMSKDKYDDRGFSNLKREYERSETTRNHKKLHYDNHKHDSLNNRPVLSSVVKKVYKDHDKWQDDGIKKPIKSFNKELSPSSEWTEHMSRTGRKYYFNIKTEVSQWEKPQIVMERETYQKMRAARLQDRQNSKNIGHYFDKELQRSNNELESNKGDIEFKRRISQTYELEKSSSMVNNNFTNQIVIPWESNDSLFSHFKSSSAATTRNSQQHIVEQQQSRHKPVTHHNYNNTAVYQTESNLLTNHHSSSTAQNKHQQFINYNSPHKNGPITTTMLNSTTSSSASPNATKYNLQKALNNLHQAIMSSHKSTTKSSLDIPSTVPLSLAYTTSNSHSNMVIANDDAASPGALSQVSSKTTPSCSSLHNQLLAGNDEESDLEQDNNNNTAVTGRNENSSSHQIYNKPAGGTFPAVTNFSKLGLVDQIDLVDMSQSSLSSVSSSPNDYDADSRYHQGDNVCNSLLGLDEKMDIESISPVSSIEDYTETHHNKPSGKIKGKGLTKTKRLQCSTNSGHSSSVTFSKDSTSTSAMPPIMTNKLGIPIKDLSSSSQSSNKTVELSLNESKNNDDSSFPVLKNDGVHRLYPLPTFIPISTFANTDKYLDQKYNLDTPTQLHHSILHQEDTSSSPLTCKTAASRLKPALTSETMFFEALNYRPITFTILNKMRRSSSSLPSQLHAPDSAVKSAPSTSHNSEENYQDTITYLLYDYETKKRPNLKDPSPPLLLLHNKSLNNIKHMTPESGKNHKDSICNINSILHPSVSSTANGITVPPSLNNFNSPFSSTDNFSENDKLLSIVNGSTQSFLKDFYKSEPVEMESKTFNAFLETSDQYYKFAANMDVEIYKSSFEALKFTADIKLKDLKISSLQIHSQNINEMKIERKT